mmetsp:Transcript_13783/g.30925  ORF Transcript_13783/g.30925 Transcript_13783/m.30925 type:complete len:143 (+) Transcript_13783:605-1033(+)
MRPADRALERQNLGAVDFSFLGCGSRVRVQHQGCEAHRMVFVGLPSTVQAEAIFLAVALPQHMEEGGPHIAAPPPCHRGVPMVASPPQLGEVLAAWCCALQDQTETEHLTAEAGEEVAVLVLVAIVTWRYPSSTLAKTSPAS